MTATDLLPGLYALVGIFVGIAATVPLVGGIHWSLDRLHIHGPKTRAWIARVLMTTYILQVVWLSGQPIIAAAQITATATTIILIVAAITGKG